MLNAWVLGEGSQTLPVVTGIRCKILLVFLFFFLISKLYFEKPVRKRVKNEAAAG